MSKTYWAVYSPRGKLIEESIAQTRKGSIYNLWFSVAIGKISNWKTYSRLGFTVEKVIIERVNHEQ